MKRFLDYNKRLKQRASEMRRNMTRAERKLWFEFLKEFSLVKADVKEWQRGCKKIKVYRQRVIDHFIVDFYIPDFKLIIELDGESHFEDGQDVYDTERTEVLEGNGCKVLRFLNTEVYESFHWVFEDIMLHCKKYTF